MEALTDSVWDVVVVGGGNAALCAAIEAAMAGCQVIVLESAPKHYRGGNSRHTRNFRCKHRQPILELTDVYGQEEYWQDLMAVTKGNTDEKLANLAIEYSESCLLWMQANGVRFQPSLTGTLSLSRTNAFFLGGGKALVNAYYNRLEDLGVTVVYDANVSKINLSGDLFESVVVSIDGQNKTVKGSAAVLASGGYQADIDWLARSWGPAARNFLIRGTPYNRGVVLANMLDQGASSVGDPNQCHAVAIDGRAPKFDGGIIPRLDCVPFSVVLNRRGERFYDEGEDLWPKRYAIWGRLVAAQPDQVCYALIDNRAVDLFMPSLFPPSSANTIEELAAKLELPLESVKKTVESYNNACIDGPFDSKKLDGLATKNLVPPKTNWARPLLEPPFHAYLLRPGVTFTYLGLKVDETARVHHAQGRYKNVWAAGEIMAGSILGEGYLAGFGMTIGTVFGRIAGQQVAKHV